VFGSCSDLESIPKLLRKVPLAAILGDQQAALFGQTCFLPGEAKVCKTILLKKKHNHLARLCSLTERSPDTF
jgi:hypothetical protein